jgi:hypothetical protein
MSRLPHRVVKWVVAVGLVAAAFALFYDAAVTIRWSGSRDVELTVEAPHPVCSVSYACCGNDEAAYYRGLPPEAWEVVLPSDRRVKTADRQPDGSFVIEVETSGKESGFKVFHNSYYQRPCALILIELETGERWVTELTLPDVTKTTRATVHIPDDARRLPPAPAGERGGN